MIFRGSRALLRAATTGFVLAVAAAACGDAEPERQAGPSTTGRPAMTSGPSSTATTTAPTPAVSDVPGAGRTFRPRDSGAAVRLRVGETAELVVPDPAAPDPAVEGAAVELVEQRNIAASGQREWEIRAVRPGRSTVRGLGSTPYVLVFDVTT